MEMETKIDFTKISNDINGNPRYVCHYLELLSDNEIQAYTEFAYDIALKKAKQIGGKKFNNKQYGGGIVFQTYNLHNLEKQILELLNK